MGPAAPMILEFLACQSHIFRRISCTPNLWDLLGRTKMAAAERSLEDLERDADLISSRQISDSSTYLYMRSNIQLIK